MFDYFRDQRLRRLEIMVMILIEQAALGSISPEHTTTLVKLSEELGKEFDKEEVARKPESP